MVPTTVFSVLLRNRSIFNVYWLYRLVSGAVAWYERLRSSQLALTLTLVVFTEQDQQPMVHPRTTVSGI